MTQPSLLPDIDLHEAVLEALAVEWSSGLCIMHLRGVGHGGGLPIRIRWHGLRELGVTGEAPWGQSGAVLETRWGDDGTDEIRMHSGDVIRVRAAGRAVEVEAESLARCYGGLAADALADAGLIEQSAVERVSDVVAREIGVRRSLGDV